MGILGARWIQTGMGKGRWGRRTGQGTVYLKMLQGNLLLSVLNKKSKYIFKALRMVWSCVDMHLWISQGEWAGVVDCFRKHRLLNILKGKVFCTDLISLKTKFTQWGWMWEFSFPTNYIDIDFIDIDTDIDISIRHNPFHCCLLCHMNGVVSSF